MKDGISKMSLTVNDPSVFTGITDAKSRLSRTEAVAVTTHHCALY